MSRASTLPLITFSYEPFSPLFSPAVLRPFFPEPTQLSRFPVSRQRALPLSSFSVSPSLSNRVCSTPLHPPHPPTLSLSLSFSRVSFFRVHPLCLFMLVLVMYLPQALPLSLRHLSFNRSLHPSLSSRCKRDVMPSV